MKEMQGLCWDAQRRKSNIKKQLTAAVIRWRSVVNSTAHNLTSLFSHMPRPRSR